MTSPSLRAISATDFVRARARRYIIVSTVLAHDATLLQSASVRLPNEVYSRCVGVPSMPHPMSRRPRRSLVSSRCLTISWLCLLCGCRLRVGLGPASGAEKAARSARVASESNLSSADSAAITTAIHGTEPALASEFVRSGVRHAQGSGSNAIRGSTWNGDAPDSPLLLAEEVEPTRIRRRTIEPWSYAGAHSSDPELEVRSSPADGVSRPENIRQLRGVVTSHERVHAVGEGHSSSPVRANVHTIDMTGMSGIMEDMTRIDSDGYGYVTVLGGTTFSTLQHFLERRGLGTISVRPKPKKVTVAGAVGTNVNSSGAARGCIAEDVLQMQVMDDDGEISTWQAGDVPSLVGRRGSAGIIVSVTLKVVPRRLMKVTQWHVETNHGTGRNPLFQVGDDGMLGMERIANAVPGRYNEFFWLPRVKTATDGARGIDDDFAHVKVADPAGLDVISERNLRKRRWRERRDDRTAAAFNVVATFVDRISGPSELMRKLVRRLAANAFKPTDGSENLQTLAQLQNDTPALIKAHMAGYRIPHEHAAFVFEVTRELMAETGFQPVIPIFIRWNQNFVDLEFTNSLSYPMNRKFMRAMELLTLAMGELHSGKGSQVHALAHMNDLQMTEYVEAIRRYGPSGKFINGWERKLLTTWRQNRVRVLRLRKVLEAAKASDDARGAMQALLYDAQPWPVSVTPGGAENNVANAEQLSASGIPMGVPAPPPR